MAPKYILEQFLEAELLVNITEHQVSASVSVASLVSVDPLSKYLKCSYYSLIISALDSHISL